MTDWLKNKGAGPWPFIPQEEKCGYVNNPRWTKAPVDPSRIMSQKPDGDHEPCGYWPKPHFINSAVNIYGLTTSGLGGIWAVYFDGTGLTYVGAYVPSDKDINGLEFYQGDLLTIAGNGAAAVLRRVRSIPPFDVVANYTSLLTDDWPNIDPRTNLFYVPDTQKYYAIGSTVGGRIVRFNSTLGREARGVYGTVITGTDGHLYALTGSNFSWLDSLKPITGASWDIFWDRIPDDVCDSPVTAWGADPRLPTYSGEAHASYADGYLYVTINQSLINQHSIRKINTSTMAVELYAEGLYITRHLVHNGIIYTSHGVLDSTITAYRTSDLVQVATSGVLPHGRSVMSDMVIENGTLIVINEPYLGNSAVYRLDLTTLATLEMTVIPGPVEWAYHRLALIDEDFIVAAENTGVGIIKIPGLVVPDERYLNTQGDPPFLNLPDFSYSTIIQQRVLVSYVSSAPVRLTQRDRCGTPPYWSMPIT